MGPVRQVRRVVPYVWLSGSTRFAGEPVERIVEGAADPQFRLSVNLYGAPALGLAEFKDYRQDLIVGAITFAAFRYTRAWPQDLILRLKIVGEFFAQALVRCRREAELTVALAEITRLKERLEAENVYLRQSLRAPSGRTLASRSPRFNQMLEELAQVAPTNATVLLQGETGTGKEVLADAIHIKSPCGQRPMVKVNCAALPASLIEAELFGREKGAYTGALARQMGRFELADGGPLDCCEGC